MLLTDFFDFPAPDDIRLKGHRIGIETVLFDEIRMRRAQGVYSPPAIKRMRGLSAARRAELLGEKSSVPIT
jgi:hypothetical protein